MKLTNKNELMGDNTVMKFDFLNKIIVPNFKIIGDDGIVRNCQFYSTNEPNYSEVVYLREHFSNETEYFTF